MQTQTLGVGSYLLTAEPVDNNGTARAVAPGSFKWALSESTDASITPQGDGSTALLVLQTDGVEVNVTVTANADPTGATDEEISGELDITVGEPVPLATSINISVAKQ